MRKVRVLAVVVCVMAVANIASADIIQGIIDIDFVTIGNPENIPDTQVMTTDGTTGYGAVGYNYRIGKYEITNAQWNAFTAVAGVPAGNPLEAYNQSAQFTGAQQPTNMVSWYEAAQFCNYLTSRDKSLGVYQIGTDGSITVDRAAAISTYGTAYVIPTEDEWYKAAYFKPNASGYSLYANGTSTAPVAGVNSNYNSGAPWDIITNGTVEQNGTFDMMGNVFEWNETLIYGSYRGIRGGCYSSRYGDGALTSARPFYNDPYYEYDDVGFRVASIPEPATLLLLGLGVMFLRKRRRCYN
ncbi:MAG: SUMF1/EgtB/PvdO family nonheme iron enzyme [Planctomycetota bacterium]|nr:SUMF1/EgtB/PvdO family nonheme iron enzyme [Planctomycetota bacterium]